MSASQTSLILRRPRSFAVPFERSERDRERPRTSEHQANSRRVRTHEKNSGDAVRRLGTIIQSIFCAQSVVSIRLTVWKWSGESRYPGAFPPVLENFCRAISPSPTDHPWVSEDDSSHDQWKMANRDSCKKRNVWSAPEEKQILLICSELEIAGQLDVCVTSASISSPI